jgi:O-antigen/teichoic acid export membrane protein
MFLTNIIAARLLTQDVFGQFMIVRSTISMLEGVVSGSLGSSMIKRVAEIRSKDKEHLKVVISTLFFVNITITLFLAVGLYFTAPYIVQTFFMSNQNLVYGLYAGSLLLVATTLSTLIQSILIGFEEYKKIAFAGIGSSLISFPVIVLLIYKFAFLGAIFGVSFYFLFDFIMKYYQFKLFYKDKITFDNIKNILKESRYLLSFSAPLFLSVIITSITFWYARVLTVESTKGFESIAVFDAAFQWLSIIMIITGATTSAALPMLSKTISIDTKNSNSIFKVNLIVNLVISITMASIFILFSKYIMAIYGEKYIGGYKDLIILSITSVFFTLAAIYNKYMIATHNSKVVFIATALSAVMLFVTFYLHIFSGSENLALSIFVYYCILTITYIISKNYIEERDTFNE